MNAFEGTDLLILYLRHEHVTMIHYTTTPAPVTSIMQIHLLTFGRYLDVVFPNPHSVLGCLKKMSSTHVDLNLTIGIVQIGSMISVFLFGIVTLQAYEYYTSFREDRWSLKILVAVVWILELTHTACVNYEVYHATITQHGEPQQLTLFPAFALVTAFGGLITLCTQGFFSWRLYKLLPKPYSYIGLSCINLSIARCLASIYLAGQVMVAPNMIQYEKQWAWLISTLLAGGAAVDVTIAVSMLFYLSSQRGKVVRRSKWATRLVDYLIAYTIRTGLLTSVSAVTMLICFQLMPSNLIWMAIYTFLGKLYSNSLYCSLNSRKEMRLSIQNIQGQFSAEPIRGSPLRSVPITIEMTTTTTTRDEDGDVLYDKSLRPILSPPTPTYLDNNRRMTTDF